MTGARRTRLSNRSGAIWFVGALFSKEHASSEHGAEDVSDADALKEQDSRNLARDARASSAKLLEQCRAMP